MGLPSDRTSIEEVVAVAPYFRLDDVTVRRVLGQVYHALRNWTRIAQSPAVGMSKRDLDDVEPAFENAQMDIAATLLK
ncbi:hypothetical protein [Massilia sp. HP4]|uniref:hypothetical protein n=1 Tax=Massilia sp. HP4 TaxID=2562316 RepID=UPI0010C15690|nr:hypothetical protein [Massilia sp. HP4]